MSNTGDFPTPMTKLIMAFLAAIGGFQLFDAGNSAHAHEYSQMAAGLIIGSFALLALWAILTNELHNAANKVKAIERDMEWKVKKAQSAAENAVKELADEMHEAIEKMGEPSKKEQIEAMIYACIDEVLGEDGPGQEPPTPEQIKQITDLFHERTDFYLKLEFKSGGVMTEVSGEPFPDTTETATTTTTGEATDVVKSKSQMRREAVMKNAAKKGK